MPGIPEQTVQLRLTVFSDLSSYYHRWYHDRPILIGTERRDELRRLHASLYAAVEALARDWREVAERWGFGSREKDILSEQARFPFKAGTWRPDYLVSEDGRLLLCEITTRFFAHGIFMSWFQRDFLAHWTAARGLPFPDQGRFGRLMDYMLTLTGDKDRIYVFKSADRSGEIRLYKRFYEAHGKKVTILEVPEIEGRRDEWADGACLVSAMNQKDILSLSERSLRAMIEGGMLSDMRTVFLTHDKRFMALWSDPWADGIPGIGFLREHAIRSWDTTDPASAGACRHAAGNKDGYILKPFRLGKSEGILPGPLCSEEEWRNRWATHPEGILQPFIKQRTFPTVWEGTAFDDYVCGMMLCVDDRYFDSGYFRASSLPVTNVGDDRKAAAIHACTPEESALLSPYCDIL